MHIVPGMACSFCFILIPWYYALFARRHSTATDPIAIIELLRIFSSDLEYMGSDRFKSTLGDPRPSTWFVCGWLCLQEPKGVFNFSSFSEFFIDSYMEVVSMPIEENTSDERRVSLISSTTIHPH